MPAGADVFAIHCLHMKCCITVKIYTFFSKPALKVAYFSLKLLNTVEPPISGHSKRRTPLISGQNIFPRPFPSQILIKKSPKGGHPISGHLHLADKNFCTEWSLTYFFPSNQRTSRVKLISDMKIQVMSVFKPFISNIFSFCFPNFLYKFLAFPLPGQ